MEVQYVLAPAAGAPALGTSNGNANPKPSTAASVDSSSSLLLEMRQFSDGVFHDSPRKLERLNQEVDIASKGLHKGLPGSIYSTASYLRLHPSCANSVLLPLSKIRPPARLEPAVRLRHRRVRNGHGEQGQRGGSDPAADLRQVPRRALQHLPVVPGGL